MNKAKTIGFKLATLYTGLLSIMAVMFASTNSCLMIHEPKRPASLKNYSRVK